MRLRLRSAVERLRSSFFFVPMLGVIGAVVLAVFGLAVDRRLDAEGVDLPLGLVATVDSARSLLSTIAGATISFAGIAFSVSLLIIQLASSQYSPRVVHTLFRDPFNRRVMALVVGTFTYCLVVLRSTRSSLEADGTPVIPNLSVALALVLGISTILAVIAFINHGAHSMDVSEILGRVRSDAVDQIRREWSHDVGDGPAEPPIEFGADATVVRFDRTGWVQEVDVDALLECLPPSASIRVETYAGRYAIQGTPVCSIWPGLSPEELGRIEPSVRSAVAIGNTRTLQQDVSYGLRQLADVALKALSPGINDPTTAQDAIFHSASVLLEMLTHSPPLRDLTDEHGRRLVLAEQPSHDDLVRLAFDETRRAAVAMPSVCIYLLEALHLVRGSLVAAGHPGRTGAIDEQARLIVEGALASDLLEHDRFLVRSAYQRRWPA
jgi:uncharacterized membrane protein